MKTVGQVFRELKANHYLKKRFKESGYDKEVDMNYRNHLETFFDNVELEAITPPVIWSWHRTYEKNPYAGNRSKSVLSKIFRYAQLRGYIPVGFNPCSVVPNHPEEKRRRYASSEEIAKIRSLLKRDRETHPQETAFILLLILTGSRPKSLERSTWNDLERLEDGCGLLRLRGKTGEETIALSQQAMAIVNTLPTWSKALIGRFPRYYWDRIRKEAGCGDLWARDWRRTFGTTALSAGVSLGMVSELLNHKDPKITMRYAKLTPQARLKTACLIGRELDQTRKNSGA